MPMCPCAHVVTERRKRRKLTWGVGRQGKEPQKLMRTLLSSLGKSLSSCLACETLVVGLLFAWRNTVGSSVFPRCQNFVTNTTLSHDSQSSLCWRAGSEDCLDHMGHACHTLDVLLRLRLGFVVEGADDICHPTSSTSSISIHPRHDHFSHFIEYSPHHYRPQNVQDSQRTQGADGSNGWSGGRLSWEEASHRVAMWCSARMYLTIEAWAHS